MAAAPLAQPARDVLRPLSRAAVPADRCITVGSARWWITGVTDVGLDPRPGDVDRTGGVLPHPVAAFARGDDAAVLAEVVGRLDETFPGWRAGSDGGPRPADVVAWRADAPGGDRPPTGRIDLFDFCSDRWRARLESGRWRHTSIDGAGLDPEAVEQFGRSGGIVLSVTDRTWRPAGVRRNEHHRPTRSPVFEGPHHEWVAAIRNCRTVLVQLGLAAGVAWQVTGVDTDLGELDAVASLVEHLQSWWHPAFACHVDVVDSIAAGLANLRFSDPNHLASAPAVLPLIVELVAATGVVSSPVQFS